LPAHSSSEQTALVATSDEELDSAVNEVMSTVAVEFKKSNAVSNSIRPVAFDDVPPPLPPVNEPAIEPVAEGIAQPIDTFVDPTAMPVASGWNLSTLESQALQNNPAIKEASAAAHKAMGYQTQVGLGPNPVVGYNATQIADLGTDQHTVFVEQDIVMGGKLDLNRNVLSHEVQSLLWEVETERYRVLTDVRRNFYLALAAQRKYELANSFHDIAAKGADFAQRRLDAKEGTVPEVLQAEIQLSQVEIQRQQADAAFRGAWRQMMTIVGTPNTTPGLLEGMLPTSSNTPDWQQIKAEILASSPELQAARARVTRAQANICRQDAQAIPNLQMMLAAGYDNGTNQGLVNAQVGVPVPFRNKNEGNISAAHAELCRAMHEVHRTELAILNRLASASQSYESAAAAVNQYEYEILPRAEKTLNLTDDAYRAGEFDFLKVLVVRRTYFESNLEYVTAQSTLAQAQAYIDGMVLSDALDTGVDTSMDSGLRDQALGGQ